MKKSTKIWLIVAGSLTLFGAIIFTGVLAMLNFDFSKLSTNKYETNRYEITEDITSISIDTDTADVIFVTSDNTFSVECYEGKNEKHSVIAKNGVLSIKLNNTKKWYQYIGINFSSPKITVTLPSGEYGDLYIEGHTGKTDVPDGLSFCNVTVKSSTGSVSFGADSAKSVDIKCSTGSISLESTRAETVEIKASTGHITVSDVVCENKLHTEVSTGRTVITNVTASALFSEGDTGNITLKRVTVEGKMDIERSTGDVRFEACDAGEIRVETDTGDVTGTLLTEKIFYVKTDTGKISVPKSTGGGICEIETDTGDIRLNVE
ncbi:MAG: DUF4097 family beta strand repeat protein [Clostridia bacterium]|nr:DUF4097 family beta strand repeat protein [Clostridia bacterium]